MFDIQETSFEFEFNDDQFIINTFETSNKNPIYRILNKVFVDQNGCWIYTGSGSHGYGHVSIKKNGKWKTGKPHKIIYEYFVGEIPDGLEPDHLCRNRACCSPLHLEPVTRRVNFLRGNHPNAIAHRENKCLKGHDLVGNNVRYKKNGTRCCRTCDIEYKRNRRINEKNKR